MASRAGAVVTCTRTGDAFPQAFQLTVEASAGSAPGCGSTTRYSAVVSSMCCVSGMTYAKDASKAACLSTIGCPAAGFVNNFTTTAATNYPLVYGDCTTSASTGTIPVSCTGTTTASVTFGAPTQAATPATGTATRYFYAGCAPPSDATNKCSPAAGFGASTCTSAACGGTLTGAGRTVTLSCPCASVRWIVASAPNAPATFTAQRVGGACLP